MIRPNALPTASSDSDGLMQLGSDNDPTGLCPPQALLIPSGESTTPHLPEPIEHILRPIFQALPVNQAMGRLIIPDDTTSPHAELIEKALEDPAMQDKPTLEAGLWLYVDDLKRSHSVSQNLQRPSGSFWHAIMHRREGDFANSHHWYRKAGQHPVMSRIDSAGGGGGAGTAVGAYHPHAFVDRVERAAAQGSDSPDLVAMQRLEWVALFQWCVENH